MCVWCCLMEHMFLFLYLHSYIHIHCSDFRFNGFSSCYRRYIAMVEMCQVAGNRDQLITLLLPLAEHVLNVILIHFQDGYDLFFFLITYCHFISLFQYVFFLAALLPLVQVQPQKQLHSVTNLTMGKTYQCSVGS